MGLCESCRSRGAGAACLRRFGTVERSGLEARAGGAVRRLALESSGVETALIAGVRLQRQPGCRGKWVLATRRRSWDRVAALSRLVAGHGSRPGRKPGVLDSLVFGARGRVSLI
jgi:hypothetical protein